MTLEDLWSLATVKRPDGYTSWPAPYDMAVCLEDAEFLHSLVRVTKPKSVLELGTGMGVSARFIADALQDNEDGHLWTVEPDDEIRAQAALMLADHLPVTLSGLSWSGNHPDLVFIDSGWKHRKSDISNWMIASGPLIVVHDAGRDYPQLLGHGVYLPGSDGMWIGRAK